MSYFDQNISFTALLDSDRFLLSAELTPPRHYDLSEFMAKASLVRQYVDYVQINDHLLSKARINNIIPGQQCKLLDIEVVLQFALIHKNRIAIQGDLLAMAASGLNNIIVLGGYPCMVGPETDAQDVNDLSTIEAIRKIDELSKQGVLFNGDLISPPPNFIMGTIEFPCPKGELFQNIDRLERKIDAGVDFVQIQAVFELDALTRWMEEVVKRNLHQRVRFLGAIFPITSYEHLKRLYQIPSLLIPDTLMRAMEASKDSQFGLKVSKHLSNGIRDMEGITGLHIRSIGSETQIPQLVEYCGLGDQMVY